MGHPICITVGELTVKAELNDSPTAVAIIQSLPLEAVANRWGEEIYFEIPVEQEGSSDARAEMQVGELGYWPPGSAFCIFFGPTPVSNGAEPRAASPVNPIGMVTSDVARLSSVADGAPVRIES